MEAQASVWSVLPSILDGIAEVLLKLDDGRASISNVDGELDQYIAILKNIWEEGNDYQARKPQIVPRWKGTKAGVPVGEPDFQGGLGGGS